MSGLSKGRIKAYLKWGERTKINPRRGVRTMAGLAGFSLLITHYV